MCSEALSWIPAVTEILRLCCFLLIPVRNTFESSFNWEHLFFRFVFFWHISFSSVVLFMNYHCLGSQKISLNFSWSDSYINKVQIKFIMCPSEDLTKLLECWQFVLWIKYLLSQVKTECWSQHKAKIISQRSKCHQSQAQILPLPHQTGRFPCIFFPFLHFAKYNIYFLQRVSPAVI